jgi:hypothetical protein
MGYMTWGQLRMQLQQSVPGLSLDKTDEFLNTTYARVLDHRKWLGLEESAYVETVAPYQSSTDTVTVTQGSTAVTGSGTNWTSGQTGLKFQTTESGALYTFTVTGATSATLDRPYESAGGSGLAYKLLTIRYPLPADCKRVISVLSADDGFPLRGLSTRSLDAAVGWRDVIGLPEAWDVRPSPEALDGGTTWQIEFFPLAEYQKGYLVRYERSANAFTGSNTSTTPLPFVSDAVLLSGARALAYADAGKKGEYAQQISFYNAKFADELNTMCKADRRREPVRPFEMADRFTRHRLRRYLRVSFPRILG